MRHSVPALLAVVCSLLPVTVPAADARSVIDKMLELQAERREGVNRYVVEQKTMGHVSRVAFERTTVTGPDGKPIDTFRVVLPEDTAGGDAGDVSREDVDRMAEGAVQTIAEFADKARLVGTEAVDGRDAYHLEATGLSRVQQFDGSGSYTLQTVNVWIDTDKYVPLRTLLDGALDTDGTPRPVTMEILEQDYRSVPDSDMYESYRQIMRMNGVMTDDTRAQVERARQQLEQLDEQLATMPQSQRDMMMNMMGDQIAMMRKLAAGDGLEFVTEVLSITVE